MAVSLQEFKEVFGKSLEEVKMNLESLFDPEVDITHLPDSGQTSRYPQIYFF